MALVGSVTNSKIDNTEIGSVSPSNSTFANSSIAGVTAQALHRSPNAVTAMFVYDTSKDSDGGAWTEKCQHTSWYNETITGKWLGVHDSELNARYEGATLAAELLINGTFATNITGWTANNSDASLSYSSGSVRVTKIASVLGWGGAKQTITGLTVGKAYRVSATFQGKSSAANAVVQIESNPGFVTVTSVGVYSFIFLATSTTANLVAGFSSTSGSVNDWFEFDNISLKEVIAITTSSNDYYQNSVDGKFYRLWKNLNGNSTVVPTSSASITYVGNAGVGPDGITNATSAETIASVGSSSSAWHPLLTAIPIGGTASFYVKSLSGDGRVIGQLGQGDAYEFDAINGVMIISDSRHTYTVSSAPNGYWRLAINRGTAGGIYPFIVPKTIGNKILVSNIQVEYGAVSSFEAKVATGTVSEVFRGNKRKFPRLAGIVAENVNVTIYDLTEPGRPMWMRFITSGGSVTAGGHALLRTVNPPSMYALNGLLGVVGTADQSTYSEISFPTDSARSITNNAAWSGKFKGNIAQRNLELGRFNFTSGFFAGPIGSAVAMTVLPDAPIDPVTGLQVPTIAVANNGGVGVIKHNGTVVNSANTSSAASVILDRYVLVGRQGAQGWFYAYNPGTLSASFSITSLEHASAPDFRRNVSNLKPTAIGRNKFAIPAGTSYPAIEPSTLALLFNNDADFNRSVTAVITPRSTTGYITGLIRRAYLADTVVGSIGPSTEIVPSSFLTDSTGHLTYDGTLVVSGGTATLTKTVSNGGMTNDFPPLNLTPGKTYLVDATLSGSGSTGDVYLDTSTNTFTVGFGLGRRAVTFTPTESSVRIRMRATNATVGSTLSVTSLSLREVDSDRTYLGSSFNSYRNNRVQQAAFITGTLTKSTVATAAQLVAYSGFSAANYLREPYSADLDFGTGEWSCSAWVNTALGSPNGNVLPSPEDFSQHNGYGNALLTLNSTATLDPAGGNNADLFIASTANNFQSKTLLSNGIPVFIGVPNTMAIRVKSAGIQYVSFIQDFAAGSAASASYFDLDAVTVTQEGSANTSSIVDIGNGWRLIKVTSYPVTTTTGARWSITMQQAGTGNVYGQNNWVGDGVSGIYVYGVQKNPGTTLATYVPGQTAVYAPVPGARIASRSFSSGAKIDLSIDVLGRLTATAFDGTTTRTVTTTAAYNTGTWIKAEAEYTTDGSLSICVNGVEVAVTRGNPLLSLNSRYNLLTKTEQFDDAAWTKNQVTAASTSATSDPLGGATADILTATASTNVHRIYQVVPVSSANIGISAGMSLKKGTYRYATVISTTDLSSGWIAATIDLDTGAITKTGVGSSGPTLTSATSTANGNGWYFVSLIGVPTQNTANRYLMVLLASSATPTYGASFADDSWAASGTESIYIWGADLRLSALSSLPYQRVNTATDFDFAAPLTIGNSYTLDAPFPGSIALLKVSATVPTAEQSIWMYEQEKQMFRDGAQVTLPDSGSIADLTYDDLTDRWIAVSPTNESEWSGLIRTSVTPSPAGSYSKIIAASGVQLQARTTISPGVDVTIPSYTLREELVNRSEAAARLSRTLVTLDYIGGLTANTTSGNTAIVSAAGITYPTSYIGARISGSGIPADTTIVAVSGTTIYMSAAATATASTVQISFLDFILPVGYEAKTVLSAGVTRVEGSTKDFTRLYDGFKETIRFGTAPGYNVAVQIQATRSAA